MVTTIIAHWTPGWAARIANPLSADPTKQVPNAPGTAGASTCVAPACDGTTWVYEDVTSGPYVWHCHINSHEDSEMMRTSLVVP